MGRGNIRRYSPSLIPPAALIYFVVFVAVVYFAIVLPYRYYQARHGVTVFGEPAPLKACPYCLSVDLPAAATKCRHCGSALELQPARRDGDETSQVGHGGQIGERG